MTTRTAAPLLIGLTWAVISSIAFCSVDARAQAKAPTDTRPSGEVKKDTAAPDSAEVADTATPLKGEAKSTDAPTPAPAQIPGNPTGAEPTAAAPNASAENVADASVTTGSGLFEQAQSAAPAESEAAGADSASKGFELGGYVRGDMFVGKVPGLNQGQMKAGYGELALKFRVQKEQYGDAYAELRFRNGLQGDVQTNIIDVREAYVNGYFGPFDLRLGKQIVVWGRADAFNPTNNITPNDLRIRSPVEDDRRVGNVGARGFLNFQPFRLEGVWMPLYVASELPAYQLPQYVYFGNTRYPQPNLDKGLGAGRLHLELPAIEMSASFVHGYAPLPGLTLQSYTYGVTPQQVLVSRTAYEQNVVGFDFSTAIGDLLGVRGEIAYRRPVGYQNKLYTPRPDVQYVFGLDHTFGNVSVIAQYLGRYALDWRRQTGPADSTLTLDLLSGIDQLTPAVEAQVNQAIADTLAQKNQMLFGQTERIQHMVSLRLEWLTLSETLSLSAFGLVNFSTREWLAFPKISYKITDRLSTAIGGEIYQGPDGTLFGMVRDVLTAGYTELRYAF
jgi:hypothetical protein